MALPSRLAGLLSLQLKKKNESKTEMTASVQGNKSKHTRGSNQLYLIRTRQNNVQILPSTQQRTNRQTDVKFINK